MPYERDKPKPRLEVNQDARLKSLAAVQELGGLVCHDYYDEDGTLTQGPIADDPTVDVSCIIFYRGRINGKYVRKVRDDDLLCLLMFPTIKELILDDSMVTDRGLKTIVQLRDLNRVTLYRTRVTDAGVAELQRELPNCYIES